MTRPTTSRKRAKAAPAKLATVLPIRPPRPRLAPRVAMPPDASRITHRAMRALVERDGDAAPRVLYEAFDYFNAAHFAGLLGSPMILISATSSPMALGDYTPRDVHGIVSRVRIAPNVFKYGWRAVLGTLLHEMIHAHQHEVLEDIETGYKGHGPRFTAKANEIGAALGFPPVAPKGRGGLARAEHWPHLPAVEGELVRPTKTRKARTAAPPAPAPSQDGERDDGERIDGARSLGAAIRYERTAVVSFILECCEQARAHGKPKLAGSFANLAAKIERSEHRPGSFDNTQGGTE